MEELALPGDSATRLAQLRVDTSLTMPDWSVLPPAEDGQARLASFDERLSAAEAGRNLPVLRD